MDEPTFLPENSPTPEVHASSGGDVPDVLQASTAAPDPPASDPVPVAISETAAIAVHDSTSYGWLATWRHLGSEIAAGVQTLLSAAVYATLIVTFGFQVARVDGMSMAPTLEDHDRLIVNKLVYELSE